ncbi:MAG: hypothetical protein NTU63_00055 [Candidatus Pacearchaeota archaeon]|nr:hypothetical protein [Candidatus Pacearchaeota archaeon]
MENTYYCRRIKSQVVADKIEDLTGRIFVQCKYDENNKKNSCLYFNSSYPDNLYPRRCLVKLTIQKETRKRLVKPKDRFVVYKIFR